MRLAERITNWCASKIEMDELKKIEIKYGIELILENFVKMAVLLLLGALFGTIFETILILAVFCTLRLFAGGIHMKTSIGCFAFTLVTWVFCLWGSKAISWSNHITIFLLCLCIMIVSLYAPADTRKNPITDNEVRDQKRKGAIITVVILSLLILFFPPNIKILMLFAMMAEVVTILPIVVNINSLREKKEEVYNE